MGGSGAGKGENSKEWEVKSEKFPSFGGVGGGRESVMSYELQVC